MRVLLIAANTERINLPTLPLGPAMVAAATRAAGHEVAFLDLMAADDPAAGVRAAIDEVEPEVIGVSVRNIDDQEMARPTFLLDKVRPVVEACRAGSDVPIVLGGAGFSLFPGPTLRYLGADIGICGEGEIAFPALLDCLQAGGDAGGVHGVVAADSRGQIGRGRVPCLDSLRHASDELWGAANLDDPEVWVPVQTRRGCPYRCSYCSTPLLEGSALRKRSPRLVAEDVARMAAAGVRQIQFVDNIFNVPVEYAIELCHRIRAQATGIRWQAILYPRKMPEELVDAMADAGCAQVSLGFESGDDRMLRAFNKRFDAAEVRRSSRLLRQHGIRQFGFLLLGGPGETQASVNTSLDFAQSLDLDLLKITIGVRIYPGTPLAARAIASGVVRSDDDLLRPRFFMVPGLESWIRRQVEARGL